MKDRSELVITAMLAFCLLAAPEGFAEDAGLPMLPDLQAIQEGLANAPEPPEINIAGSVVVAQVAESDEGCQAPVLPPEFTIKERMISLTTTLDIKNGSKDLGKIAQKLLSLTRSFTYDDASGNRIAEARAKLISWGTQVVVTDCEGRRIGTIKEEIFKSLFKVHTIYKILDERDQEIAQSEKVDWIATSFTLRDGRGQKVAELKRPWINFLFDSWDVKVYDSTVVDSRMLVMIAAYKTSVDNARRLEASDSSSSD